MRFFLFFLFFTLCCTTTFSQKKVNTYKYVLVPESYEFTKGKDAYQLNSLTQFLFEKYGFTAFVIGSQLPDDLKDDKCNALSADVTKQPGMFVTKLVISLKDCFGTVIFTSGPGKSREKEFKKAYQEALRNAFKDIEKLNYSYQPVSNKEKAEVVTVPSIPQSSENLSISKKDIENKKPKESANLSLNKTVQATQNSVASDNKEILKKDSEEHAESDTNEAIALKKEVVENKYNSKKLNFILRDFQFQLQPTPSGYIFIQILDSEKKQLGTLVKSSRDTTYLVNAGDYSGVAYFDAFGNLILERVNPATNQLIKDTFARQ
ncbi:hypothetical protein NBT05_00440 [Aquimarina sp. ERC-38]|uniref:hypothetical protein n=1 Tax=Aquimarina sp. ERC-38 TaxID=2949996 RepID=UPI0022458E36|nr:hypothetical protein [Aquimarina sp. ERC-38]UZO80966.1 hypothetical protein NBT05_00440 [Aquimarina sp. ERC-38]